MAEPGGQVMPHPDAPEFAAVRAELAKLYIRHALDLGLGGWTDEQIIERVADITATLIGCGQVAMHCGDCEWLARHRWFSDAATRLFKDQHAMPLDG
jgi:hypothetical protein